MNNHGGCGVPLQSSTVFCCICLFTYHAMLVSGQHPSLLSFLAVAGVAEADSIVLVVDGQAGLHPSDEEVLAWLRQHHPSKPVILAVNKCESVTKGPTQARCNSNIPSHHCHCETQIAKCLRLGNGFPWVQQNWKAPCRKVMMWPNCLLTTLLALLQAAEFWELGLEPFPVSAISGTGTGEMLDKLIASLPPPKSLETVDERDKPLSIAIVGRPNVGEYGFS